MAKMIFAFSALIGKPWNVYKKGLPNNIIQISLRNGLSFLVSITFVDQKKAIISCSEFKFSLGSSESSAISLVVEIISANSDDGMVLINGEKLGLTIVKLNQQDHYTVIGESGDSINLTMKPIYSKYDKQEKEDDDTYRIGPIEIKAPMHGRLSSILVSDGDVVKVTQTLLIIEAMKMEHSLKAPISGKVKFVSGSDKSLKSGQIISDGTHLFDIIPLE